MSTSSRASARAPTPTSLRPTLRLRPAQAAPVRRGQPASGEGIPGGCVRVDGCAPSWWHRLDGEAFAGVDED